MIILLSFNGGGARNVQVLIELKNDVLARRFKKLMDEKRHQEAFELVYSKSESDFYYLDPEKEHTIRPPEYILVEDLIARGKSPAKSTLR
jgi:sulfur transfer complex TusBCD TusB component (DsrH family)